MIWVGEKGRDVYNTWNLSSEESKKLTTYYEKFEAYVKPKSNNIFARYKFHNIVQQEKEPFEQFLTKLKIEVKDCGYKDPDEMVRDRVVIGCYSQKVREKLIQEGSELTLEKAVDIARTQEMSNTQLQSMAPEESNVNSLREERESKQRYKHDRQYQRNVKHQNTKQGYKQSCSKCGIKHEKNQCPAEGKICAKCKKLNHFERVCKSKFQERKRNIHGVEKDESSDDDLYVGSVGSTQSMTTNEWYEDVKIADKTINVQLDTGAKCNVISIKDLQRLGIKANITKSEAQLKSYSGHTITTKGVTTLPCEYKRKTYQVKFHVVEIPAPPVFSASTCKEMGLVERVHAVESSKLRDRPNADPSMPSKVNSTQEDELLKGYDEVFSGLGCLPGEHTIEIDHSFTPVVHPPRKVPLALKEQIKEELERMENAGVVVKQTEPTDWVNSMVTVIKPEKIRVCIDPRDLNQAIKREHYPMKTIEEVVAEMPEAKLFSVLDATSRYWLMKLDEESSKLCTFNTPFGRYRFTRLPFGIKSAPEVFQKKMSQVLEDIDGAEAIVDDILVWGRDIQEHDARLKKVLDRVKEVNLKLNPKKCQIRKEEIPYVGHLLTKDGLKPDPEKIRAVQEMTQPSNTKELKTFLGFIQYLAKFLPNMAEVSAPLRKLLEKNTAWHWEKQQEDSFQQLKRMATSAPVLSYYDAKKPVTLSVDASSKGLGAVLYQEEKPVAYASRALTLTQQKYAQIEKETLAIVFGTTKFHKFLFGKQVVVTTDHKPLEYIFNKPLYQTPLRLQKMLLTLQRYDLRIVYKPGKGLFIADALSRNYLDETNETLVPQLEVNEVHLTAHLPMSPEKYKEFQKATAEDPVLQAVKDAVHEGWPKTKAKTQAEIKPYWTCKDEISCVDGLLFKGNKVIVPKSLQPQMLDIIHESHQGIVKSKQRARDLLFWPGMASQIEDKVSKCQVCAQHQKAQAKEPMISSKIPDRPWAKIGVDLFEYNNTHYLLSVDYYSKWIEIAKLDNQSSKNTITYLQSQFSRYGIPDQLISDNGPQFISAEFAEFSHKYGFTHITSSPQYPQANGEAERAVQTVKHLLTKAKDPYKALMDYRNTPLEEINLSPAQLMMGRRLKTSLPTALPLLQSQVSDSVQRILTKQKEKQKQYYDKRTGQELPPLQPGETVQMKHGEKWIPAKVLSKHQSPRSYLVESEQTGQKYRRNRRHLRSSKIPLSRKQQEHEREPSNTPKPSGSSDKQSSQRVHGSKTTKRNSVTTRSGRAIKPPEYLMNSYER